MSILLDALRKSERQQRKGELPDIHAEDPSREERRSGGPRSWIFVTLGVLVILVLGVFGWNAWQGYRVPTAAPEFTDAPTGRDPARDTRAASGAGTDEANPPGAVNGSARAATPPARAEAETRTPSTTAARPSNPGPRLDRQPRSPVETLQSDKPLQAASRPAPTPGSREAGQAAAAATAPARSTPTPARPAESASTSASTSASPPASASDRRPAAPRQTDEQIEAVRSAVETIGLPETDASAPRRNARQPAEPDDDSISFWQLPEMTRNALPELRINVMVYDEDPARRFIIMGGKRYQEGADIDGNLQLEQVKRDRALFRYGAYLFYVKQ
ncbi:MAG: general secretion pathway protein GspB [Xanthomonadales bacterium]|nr:general secretion pathway protein GspB [Xanthomonadales bacterium]